MEDDRRLCQEILDDFSERERERPDHALITLGVQSRPSRSSPWSAQVWIDDSDLKRHPTFQRQLTTALRTAQSRRYGDETFTVDPLTDDEIVLNFSFVSAMSDRDAPSKMIVWGISTHRSPSGFTPLRLRELFHFISTATAYQNTGSPSLRWIGDLITAGDTQAALGIVQDLTNADAAILWEYDSHRRRFNSIETSGIADPRSYTVDSYFGHPQSSVTGIVSRVRPEDLSVIYDAKDESLWRPRDSGRGWRPHDQKLFRDENWRSCIAWPVSYRGGLVGAIAVYSQHSASSIRATDRLRHDLSHLFAGLLNLRSVEREREQLRSMFDEEVSRASISLMALGYLHDVVSHHETLEKSVDHASLEVSALKKRSLPVAALAKDVSDIRTTLDKADAVIQQMRRVAIEAQVDSSLEAHGSECDPVLVAQELHEFLAMVGLRTSERRLRKVVIAPHASSEGLKVPMRRERLERILVNLVTNAGQWHATEFKLDIRRSGATLLLTATDNGAGIAAGDRSQVFELFVTRRSGGSGLGLYLVRQFVRDSGGMIEVREPKGLGGTAMVITLPIANVGR